MIKNIKNISGQSLDWGLGLIQSVGETIKIDVHNHYNKLCEYTTLEYIEVYAYDNSIISGSDARVWALNKKQRIDNNGHYPLIYDLVEPFFQNMPFHSIHYKINLISGVKLHPVYNFDINGSLVDTTYYLDDSKTVEILQVTSSYTFDDSQTLLEPSARDVLERDTDREWIQTNGIYHSYKKTTHKKYDSFEKKNEEGQRRRGNLINTANLNLATAIILTGNAANPIESQNLLVDFFQRNAASIDNYKITGGGNIYTDIDTDSGTWLDTTVQDDANTQALVPQMIGSTMRDYAKNKLKAKIK